MQRWFFFWNSSAFPFFCPCFAGKMGDVFWCTSLFCMKFVPMSYFKKTLWKRRFIVIENNFKYIFMYNVGELGSPDLYWGSSEVFFFITSCTCCPISVRLSFCLSYVMWGKIIINVMNNNEFESKISCRS